MSDSRPILEQKVADLEAALAEMAIIQGDLAIAMLDLHRRIQQNTIGALAHRPVVIMTSEEIMEIVKHATAVARRFAKDG